MKRFTVTGNCVPEKDYMVDISGKITQIKKLIDDGYYFTINRGRQYGKTTTLYELRRCLPDKYTVIKISFEGLGDESFESAEKFCPMFTELITQALQSPSVGAEQEYIEKWKNAEVTDFKSLNRHITNMCKDKKLVLMIDEVDRTSNNRVFLHFINMLREKYLARKNGDDYTFQSVILAGVYDIKNIKLKLINEGSYTPGAVENKIYNSPWNIAVDFTVDMSFYPAEIATMLSEYETDHNTGMDISEISEEIYDYTNGYPFLVSRICQCIDEKLEQKWTVEGVQEAVKIILHEKNMLFDDLFKNLENNQELYDFIYDILITGRQRTFSGGNPVIDLALTYNIIAKENEKITVSNKIFEIIICDYFISKDENKQKGRTAGIIQQDILKNGRFDMELCLRKFAGHYAELFNEDDAEFLERHGRLLFLSYLKPLINGQGFYHIESQFTDLRRMDVVVDFGRDQFIIELKIWRGEKYQDEAHEQLCAYLDSKRKSEGYLLTFDFRKNAEVAGKAKWLELGDKRIFSVIV